MGPCLVLGGAGFIGTNLAHRLLSDHGINKDANAHSR